jgi:hypothetical protein
VYGIITSLADYVSDIYYRIVNIGKRVVNFVIDSSKALWNFLVNAYQKFVSFVKILWAKSTMLFMKLGKLILNSTLKALEDLFQDFLKSLLTNGTDGAYRVVLSFMS